MLQREWNIIGVCSLWKNINDKTKLEKVTFQQELYHHQTYNMHYFFQLSFVMCCLRILTQWTYTPIIFNSLCTVAISRYLVLKNSLEVIIALLRVEADSKFNPEWDGTWKELFTCVVCTYANFKNYLWHM